MEPPPTGAGGSGALDGGGDARAGDAAAEETNVAGTLVWLDGDDFETSQPFIATAAVHAQAAAGGLVSGAYDGQTFAIDGVLVSPVTWFAAEPENGLDALTTITAVDTRIAGDVLLRLGRPSALDLIFGVLTVPATVDNQRAHVVLRFIDAVSLEPVEGVVVSIAQAALTAYAVGGTWSDDAAGTSALGLAIAGNLPAVALPGSFHQVVLSGAAGGTVDVLLASGSLTLVDVALGG